MSNPKVLIGVVTASQKDYCVEEFKEQLKGFTYDNYEVLVVDNSEDPTHVNMFNEFKTKFVSRIKENNTYKIGSEMLAECQNVVREEFLKGGYEYLFMLESDVFIDKDIIQFAVSHEAPVYTVTYPIKVGRYNTPSMCVQYLHKLAHKGIGRTLMNTLMLPPTVIFPAEIKPITHYKLGDKMCLTHTGLGCTFIRRDVLNYIGFRTDRNNDRQTGAMTFSDTFFYTDCLIKGIEVLYDSRLICKHIKKW